MVFEGRLSHRRKLKTTSSIFVLLLALGGNAFALERTSTMREWSEADPADRRRLLESLATVLTPAFKSREEEILACVNLAAESSAHAELPVSEIAKACAEPPNAPAGPDSKDI